MRYSSSMDYLAGCTAANIFDSALDLVCRLPGTSKLDMSLNSTSQNSQKANKRAPRIWNHGEHRTCQGPDSELTTSSCSSRRLTRPIPPMPPCQSGPFPSTVTLSAGLVSGQDLRRASRMLVLTRQLLQDLDGPSHNGRAEE
jgi:hypothetical protein